MITDQKKHAASNINPENLWSIYYLNKGASHVFNKYQGGFIIFVIKGSIKVIVNGLDKHIVNSKEMFMLQDDCSYTINCVRRQAEIIACPFCGETLLSEQALIDELLSLYNDKHDKFNKLPFKGGIMSYLVLLQNYISNEINSYYFFDLKRKEFFFILFVYYSKEELAQFLHAYISKNVIFKEFVMANYNKVKDIKELASLANYSTSGFIKKFQRCFNDSPYRWMQKQRAQQILIEIKQGIKPLQEISIEYKFSSYQHFSNFCKKQFGFPPTKVNS